MYKKNKILLYLLLFVSVSIIFLLSKEYFYVIPIVSQSIVDKPWGKKFIVFFRSFFRISVSLLANLGFVVMWLFIKAGYVIFMIELFKGRFPEGKSVLEKSILTSYPLIILFVFNILSFLILQKPFYASIGDFFYENHGFLSFLLRSINLFFIWEIWLYFESIKITLKISNYLSIFFMPLLIIEKVLIPV